MHLRPGRIFVALLLLAGAGAVFHFKADAGALTAIGVLGLTGWLVQRHSGAIVLRLFRARPVGAGFHPNLQRIGDELSGKAGLLPLRLFVVQSEAPNAFATGRNGRDAAVAVTTGLLKLLNERELTGVLAHELAHLRQRGESAFFSAAAVTGGVSLLVGLVRSAMILSAGRRRPISGLVTAPLAAVATSLGTLAASRSREFAADAMGAEICGNPLWLAGALRKLQAFPGAEPAARQSLHPPVGERIRRLEAMAYGAYVSYAGRMERSGIRG